MYFISSNSPHITFPFYPHIPWMAARFPRAAITLFHPIPILCVVEKAGGPLPGLPAFTVFGQKMDESV